MFEINKDFSNANLPRTIRFTEKIFSELSEAAAKENISLNMLVLQCCRYALDHMAQPDKKI